MKFNLSITHVIPVYTRRGLERGVDEGGSCGVEPGADYFWRIFLRGPSVFLSVFLRQSTQFFIASH